MLSYFDSPRCLSDFAILNQIWPVTTPFIRTYRLPTPLLIFQIALIVGSFLTGFLLSPFLVLSRNAAQRPAHRLKFPEEKLRNRRYYALGFYVGTVLCVGGLIGLWARWCLGYRDPWLWTVFYLTEGRKKWSRPVLLGYWGLLGCISVAGWGRQVARSRRFRLRSQTGTEDLYSPVSLFNAASSAGESSGSSSSGNSLVGSFPTMPNISMPSMPSLSNGSNVATDLLDAADKQIPTLGLNARRKFFHGLSVAMFIPGIALDVRRACQPDKCMCLLTSALAGLYTSLVQRCVRVLHICGICSIFCGVSVRCCDPHIHERVSGSPGQRNGDSEPFLPPHRVCRVRVVRRVRRFLLTFLCWLIGSSPSPILLYTGVLTLGVGDAAVSCKHIPYLEWQKANSASGLDHWA